MLRKHLQRLEQPLEGEKFETDSGPQEDDIDHDDSGMHISASVEIKILDSLFRVFVSITIAQYFSDM